jgi:transketolase
MVIIDRNRIQVDGPTSEILDFEPVADKWKAFGWDVESLDGHSISQLTDAYDRFAARSRQDDAGPSLIIAETVGGRGVSFIEDQAAWHLGYLADADREAALDEILHGSARDNV